MIHKQYHLLVAVLVFATNIVFSQNPTLDRVVLFSKLKEGQSLRYQMALKETKFSRDLNYHFDINISSLLIKDFQLKVVAVSSDNVTIRLKSSPTVRVNCENDSSPLSDEFSDLIDFFFSSFEYEIKIFSNGGGIVLTNLTEIDSQKNNVLENLFLLRDVKAHEEKKVEQDVYFRLIRNEQSILDFALENFRDLLSYFGKAYFNEEEQSIKKLFAVSGSGDEYYFYGKAFPFFGGNQVSIDEHLKLEPEKKLTFYSLFFGPSVREKIMDDAPEDYYQLSREVHFDINAQNSLITFLESYDIEKGKNQSENIEKTTIKCFKLVELYLTPIDFVQKFNNVEMV